MRVFSPQSGLTHSRLGLELSTRMTKSVLPSDLCKAVGEQTLTLESDGVAEWDGGIFSRGTLYRQ